MRDEWCIEMSRLQWGWGLERYRRKWWVGLYKYHLYWLKVPLSNDIFVLNKIVIKVPVALHC